MAKPVIGVMPLWDDEKDSIWIIMKRHYRITYVVAGKGMRWNCLSSEVQ